MNRPAATDAVEPKFRIHLAKQRGIPARGAPFMPWKPITQGLADILFLHIVQNVLHVGSPREMIRTSRSCFLPKLSNILSTSSASKES